MGVLWSRKDLQYFCEAGAVTCYCFGSDTFYILKMWHKIRWQIAENIKNINTSSQNRKKMRTISTNVEDFDPGSGALTIKTCS
jgi:hypothetical protein